MRASAAQGRLPRWLASRPAVRRCLVSAALIGLCVLLYFLRRPSITLQPGLYAEDGSIFLQAAIDHGPSSLFELYAGYSHLLQRITALVAVDLLPPLRYPRFFLLVAWAAWLLPLVVIETLIHTRVFGRLMRVAYIPYVFYPYAGETYLNLPNAYIFFPLGFILLAFGEVHRQRVGSPATILPRAMGPLLLLYGLVAALTGPFLAIYTIPLLIFQGVSRRGIPWRPLWLSVPVLLSSLQLYLSQLQTAYPLSTGQALAALLRSPVRLLDWVLVHLACPLLGGYKPVWYLRGLPIPVRLSVVLAMLALVLLALRVVRRRMPTPALLDLATLSTLLLSFSSLLVSIRRGLDMKLLVIEDAGGRFFYWNTVLFLSVLLIAFTILVSDPATRWRRPCRLLTIWLVLTVIFYHNNIFARSEPLPYSAQLVNQCLSKDPLALQVWGGPVWSFRLSPDQIARLCGGRH